MLILKTGEKQQPWQFIFKHIRRLRLKLQFFMECETAENIFQQQQSK